ncbi:hypothetical protein DL93DRAFT_843163 [Clavulina sp. PMI_390]|nr:hypothetical protein DL93DRAFT_843163 [Clavulina sp. PMI_390]
MMSYFLQGTCAHRFSWTIIGTGIRLAQDMGMHRRKHGKGPISLQDEQEKRAFWCLLAIDRYMSSAIGRPLACQDEDFDLDFPVEVDDEYWSIPDHDGAPVTVPRQPTGVPSKLSYFVASLKLYQILALVLRALYSIGKSKVFLGSDGENWDQRIVSELDSRMNQWFDTVPAHLKWDPDRQNAAHFMQSAILYTHYYHLQILIHRPFLRPTKGSSSLSFSSLSISTNAARSCIHVLEAVQNNGGRVPPPVLGSATHSGIVLLMAVWGARKTGVNVDSQTAMRDVKQCISFLKSCESRSQAARVLVDVLEDLANCGELDLSHTPPSVKRGHSQSQDNLPIPPDASESDLASKTKGEIPLPSSQQFGASPLHHPHADRAITTPPPPSVPPGQPLMSPTTEFLQSYVASLPLHGLVSGSNHLHDDPALSSSIGAGPLEESGPIFPIPKSANLAPLTPAPAGNEALDRDRFVESGPQGSGSADRVNGFRSLEGDLFTNSPRISLLSVEPVLHHAHLLGYEGFGGTLGFVAEAQAFLGSGPEGPHLVENAEDIDWSNILNLG